MNIPDRISKLVTLSLFIAAASLLFSCGKSNENRGSAQVVAASIAIIETPSDLQSISKITPDLTLEFQPPTVTPMPTTTSSRTPFATATSSATPTPTPIGSCTQRNPGEALLALVTLEYGLSRDFVPSDLVKLSDYLPVSVTLGYPTRARRISVQPLQRMIRDMETEGLRPQVVSGYRSYSAQAIAWSKWLDKVPATAAIVSAPPGHSEHQLGTTFDFGSPELPEIVGEEDIQFHTYFYKTSEGRWLLEHAHEYGFSLSYPREAFELTGFYYEPWHYRYIGPELAKKLKDENKSLFEYLALNQEAPCIP